MKKFDPLGESAFSAAESKLTGIPGHGPGYTADLHGPTMGVKAPGLGGGLSPGRMSSVKKAAAASVAKRRAKAAMKPPKAPAF
jgi:hypothetical protein